MSTSNTRHEAPAGRLVKVLVPWILLLIIAFRVWGMVGDFRSANSRSGKSSTDTTATSSSTTSTTSSTKTGTSQTPVAAKGTVLVLIDGLNFRVEPKSSAKVIATLDAKERLALLSQQGSWYRVRTSDGKVGWVTANTRWTKLEGK